jgi:hypothetical protein
MKEHYLGQAILSLRISILETFPIIGGCNLLATSTTSATSPAAAPRSYNQSTIAVLPTPTLNQTPRIVHHLLLFVLNSSLFWSGHSSSKHLRERIWTVALYVSPQGLRFSSYTYVQETDQIFPPTIVADLSSDSTTCLWGASDGSSEPIDLSFSDYYAKFINNEDFADAPR